jgi:hypothetical protein
MSEFKGTKGKWKLENIDNNWVVMSNDGNLVGINNNKANALLISKAPEMLAMLKNIYTERINGGDFDTREVYRLMKEATDNG